LPKMANEHTWCRLMTPLANELSNAQLSVNDCRIDQNKMFTAREECFQAHLYKKGEKWPTQCQPSPEAAT